MATPYITPLKVWQRLGRADRKQNTVATLETGDIVQLQEHVISGTVQVLDSSGNEISDTDYSIDTDFNQLTYTASTTLNDVTINYFTSHVPDSRTQSAIEQAESHIDNHLNLTFGGKRRRVKEVYKTDNGNATGIMFDRQPVQEVETVWLNTNTSDDTAPNWEQLTEDEDYIVQGRTGIKLTSNISSYLVADSFLYGATGRKRLSRSDKQVRVTYTYGYENVPADIENLAEILMSSDEFKNAVFGAGIDGRDNFDPQTVNRYQSKIDTIKQEWTRRFYDNFSSVVTQGTDEEVQ